MGSFLVKLPIFLLKSVNFRHFRPHFYSFLYKFNKKFAVLGDFLCKTEKFSEFLSRRRLTHGREFLFVKSCEYFSLNCENLSPLRFFPKPRSCVTLLPYATFFYAKSRAAGGPELAPSQVTRFFFAYANHFNPKLDFLEPRLKQL